MASFLDKFKVTTAIDTNTDLDLSCTHITTSDWMHQSPVYIKECVPGETLSVHHETFTRLAPMSVPTFGRGLIHNRAFFVPFRTIFSKWNDFITSSPLQNVSIGANSTAPTGSTISVNRVPILPNGALVSLFTRSASTASIGTNTFATMVTPSSGFDPKNVDIVYLHTNTAATQTTYYFNLTDKGRRVMKVFQSLGYSIFWSTSDIADQGAALDAAYSALPFMAWLKVINDWYYPSQYIGGQSYNYVESILNNEPDSTGAFQFTGDVLRTIFLSDFYQGLTNYDSDYFVSAFDNPVGTTTGALYTGDGSSTLGQGGVIRDITTNNTGYTTGVGSYYGQGNNGYWSTNGTPQIGQFDGSVPQGTYGTGHITQYAIDALKALTDYTKRHQLVGARALDRFYARFGKSLSSEKMNRSMYIGADNIPLQIGDVMSHSDTTGAALGDYAGKGVAYGANGDFKITTDEYGVLIIMSSIIPQIGYYQGIDRNVMHVGRLDYWTPEFDQLGNQAIAKKELYLPMNVNAEGNNSASSVVGNWLGNSELNTGIFGYSPRYSEYKIGRDRLTGDYRYASKNGAGDTSDAWHMLRQMGTQYASSTVMKHGQDFVSGKDYNQYNRIFNNTESNADKFYVIHTFNVKSSSPMHSLYDTYKFENEDEGAKKVVADVNGVKVN